MLSFPCFEWKAGHSADKEQISQSHKYFQPPFQTRTRWLRDLSPFSHSHITTTPHPESCSTRCPGQPGWPNSHASRWDSSSGRVWAPPGPSSRDSTASSWLLARSWGRRWPAGGGEHSDCYHCTSWKSKRHDHQFYESILEKKKKKSNLIRYESLTEGEKVCCSSRDKFVYDIRDGVMEKKFPGGWRTMRQDGRTERKRWSHSCYCQGVVLAHWAHRGSLQCVSERGEVATFVKSM